VFSPLIDLHINIHQHLWNLLVITPSTNFDACLSGVYAEVDSLKMVLKSRQHQGRAPPFHLMHSRTQGVRPFASTAISSVFLAPLLDLQWYD
jgi:hypothetical protein